MCRTAQSREASGRPEDAYGRPLARATGKLDARDDRRSGYDRPAQKHAARDEVPTIGWLVGCQTWLPVSVVCSTRRVFFIDTNVAQPSRSKAPRVQIAFVR